MINLHVAEHAKADVTIFQCIDSWRKMGKNQTYSDVFSIKATHTHTHTPCCNFVCKNWILHSVSSQTLMRYDAIIIEMIHSCDCRFGLLKNLMKIQSL